MYILLCGYPPFFGDTDPEILSRVKKGKFDFEGDEWSEVTTDAKNLISIMLKIEPSQRPTCEKLLQDSWFNKAKNVKLNIKINTEGLKK